MIVITALTAIGAWLAHRSVASDARRDLEQEFQSELSALHQLQTVRHEELVTLCRALVEKPRIHAALEDNALDLLYPSARDDLRELMSDGDAANSAGATSGRARFYRFLDGDGRVLPPSDSADAGAIEEVAAKQLTLSPLPETPQVGYINRGNDEPDAVDEVLAVPIFSTETGKIIAALAAGFRALEMHANTGGSLKSGLWTSGKLHLPSLAAPDRSAIAFQLERELEMGGGTEGSFKAALHGAGQLVFFKRLNPGSRFPPAYEVCAYSLGTYEARQRRLIWEIAAAGGLLLLAGFVASRFIADRLSTPVEELAVGREADRAERQRVEAELENTNEELERSTRYSADASHQLKSPVAVMRAGLETLLARDDLKPEVYEELEVLVHQTYRLTNVVDDLLLLSRMDAGNLKLQFESVDLRELVEEWLDDFSAMPDATELKTEANIARGLFVAAERRYATLIVQNLLENARKYNRPGGVIRIDSSDQSGVVSLRIGNNGASIPSNMQKSIFERFHRAANGESVPGNGLGLNLARDLARLHGGDLRLISSATDWTVFEVRFRAAESALRRP
jgi:signal transduction histidine kinase